MNTVDGSSRRHAERSNPPRRQEQYNLAPHEFVRSVVTPHWTVFLPAAAFLIGLFLIPVGMWQSTDTKRDAPIVFAVLCVVAPVMFLGSVRARRANRMIVTNQRLIFVDGMVHKNVREVPIGQVTNVSTKHDPIQALIGTGTVNIDIAGKLGPEILPNVSSPTRVAELLAREVDKFESGLTGGAHDDDVSRAPGRTTPEIEPELDPLEQIQRLHELVKDGSITVDEYESVKQRLLDRL